MNVHAPTQPVEHHPGAREYAIIAVILTVITAVEVAAWYIFLATPDILKPVLIILSITKFALVVMFYMHLKFDNRLFTSLFVFGLSVAIFMTMCFIAIFHG